MKNNQSYQRHWQIFLIIIIVFILSTPQSTAHYAESESRPLPVSKSGAGVKHVSKNDAHVNDNFYFKLSLAYPVRFKK